MHFMYQHIRFDTYVNILILLFHDFCSVFCFLLLQMLMHYVLVKYSK